MTAINAWIEPHRATIYTDGAWIDPKTGTLAYCAPKILPMPHLTACLFVRGDSTVIHAMQSYFPGLFASFDEAVAGAGRMIIEPLPNLREALSPEKFGAWQLVLIGYSDRLDRFGGFFMQGVQGPSGPEWEVQPFMRLLTPSSPEMLADLEPVDADPGPDAAASIMERQRPIVSHNNPAGPMLVVGGFCQRTCITREGISTTIVRHWPDELGAPLGGRRKARGSARDPFHNAGRTASIARPGPLGSIETVCPGPFMPA